MKITEFHQPQRPHVDRIMIDEKTWQQIYLAYLSSIGIKFVKWED